MGGKKRIVKNISELKKRFNNVIPPEQIAKLKGNKAELELIPEGVGKLEILVPNLFKEIEQGEEVTLKFNIINETPNKDGEKKY